MTTCKRPDCQNELHTGKGYCSNRCAAMDRKRVKLEKEQATALAVIPNHMVERLEVIVGKDQAQLVALEVNKFLAEERISIPVPLVGNTYSDLVLSYDGTKDYRPGSQLSFDIIDKMLRSGPVVFAMEMKRAQVFRVFSQGRFKVISPDTELAEVAEAALRLILPKMAQDLTWSAFAYGVSFQEEIWERKTKYQLGMSEQKDKVEFVVPKVPKSVKPSTVDHIRRTKDGSFDGFAQRGKTAILNDLIEVDATQALVVPLNERFGNLWGESILKAVYLDWLWYEIIFRTMARYMERMASPTAIAEAPSRATVTVSGSSTPVKAMDLALALAGSLQKSNAVAIPSDTDENNNKLWSIKYLEAGERAQPFLTVLEYLAQCMIRDALSADRSLSQSSGGVGSYNIGEVHAAASAVTSEMILLQFLHYINSYFMPDFSLYNRGQDGPPIWLRTQAIDTQERQLLMQLISVAGNSPAAQELFYMIDWRTLLDTSNIPPLAEDKVDELKQKLDDEQADKMERQQEIMAKNQAPVPAGGSSMFKKTDTAKQATASKNGGNSTVKNEIELEAEAWGNVLTNRVPWMLGEHEARILYEAGLIDDQVVRLFNPFHDGLGRFASRSGGAVTKKPTKQAEPTLASQVGDFVSQHKKEIAIGGAVIGAAVIGAAVSAHVGSNVRKETSIVSETIDGIEFISAGRNASIDRKIVDQVIASRKTISDKLGETPLLNTVVISDRLDMLWDDTVSGGSIKNPYASIEKIVGLANEETRLRQAIERHNGSPNMINDIKLGASYIAENYLGIQRYKAFTTIGSGNVRLRPNATDHDMVHELLHNVKGGVHNPKKYGSLYRYEGVIDALAEAITGKSDHNGYDRYRQPILNGASKVAQNSGSDLVSVLNGIFTDPSLLDTYKLEQDHSGDLWHDSIVIKAVIEGHYDLVADEFEAVFEKYYPQIESEKLESGNATVSLFNPNHDELGRFAPKQGSPISEFVGGKVTSRTIGKFTSGDPAALDYIKKNDFLSDRGLWGRTGEGERLQAMQGLVDNVTKAHQTTPIEVKYMPRLVEFANPYVLGYFDGKSLNLSRHYTKNQTIGVNVAMHEYRHHYQWEAATGKIKHDPQEAAIWRDNFINYKTPERHGFRAYYNQPIEVDARDYSNSITYAAYGEIVLEDSNIRLFNPNHDNLGRFAPKSGSGVVDRAKDWAAAHKKEIAIGVGIGVVGGAAALYFATRKDPSAWPDPDKNAVNIIKSHPKFADWDKLPANERAEIIKNDIIPSLAKKHGINPPIVQYAKNVTEKLNGLYNEDAQRITLNIDRCENSRHSIMDAMHEYRHHYQRETILGNTKDSRTSTSAEWADNWANYFQIEDFGFDVYFNQPLEVDANDYANAIARAVFGGTNAS